MVVVSVEPDAHVVFAENLVAFGDRGANFVFFVEASERDIQIFFVVTDHHFGRFRGGDVVARIGLIKILQNLRRLPDFVVEFAVNHRRRGKFDYADGSHFLRRQIEFPAVSVRRFFGIVFCRFVRRI